MNVINEMMQFFGLGANGLLNVFVYIAALMSLLASIADFYDSKSEFSEEDYTVSPKSVKLILILNVMLTMFLVFTRNTEVLASGILLVLCIIFCGQKNMRETIYAITMMLAIAVFHIGRVVVAAEQGTNTDTMIIGTLFAIIIPISLHIIIESKDDTNEDNDYCNNDCVVE